MGKIYSDVTNSLRISINTEILRLYHKPDPQHTLELIIFQQVFTVAIIIL